MSQRYAKEEQKTKARPKKAKDVILAPDPSNFVGSREAMENNRSLTIENAEQFKNYSIQDVTLSKLVDATPIEEIPKIRPRDITNRTRLTLEHVKPTKNQQRDKKKELAKR